MEPTTTTTTNLQALRLTYNHRRAVQRSFVDQQCAGARQARQARRAAFKRYYQALQPQDDVFAEVNAVLFGERGASITEYALILSFVAIFIVGALVILSDWILALWQKALPLLPAMGG